MKKSQSDRRNSVTSPNSVVGFQKYLRTLIILRENMNTFLAHQNLNVGKVVLSTDTGEKHSTR